MIVHPAWVALAALAAPTAGPAPASDLADLLARVDVAWAERDDPERLAEATRALEEAARAAPEEYVVLWRQARVDAWLSDDPALDRKERSRLGRRGWEAAERAIQRGPARVEGYMFAALTMGNYALSLGILRALRDGIEEKFRSRLRRAEAADPAYLGGTVFVAWGRFYDELPWPKRDGRRAEQSYHRALAVNPANVRARVYLAELYLKGDRTLDARRLLDEALATPPGAYDAPEERRMQARAREILSRLENRERRPQ